MFGKNVIGSLIITGLVLAIMCLPEAEASITENIEYSFDIVNELLQIPEVGSIVPVDISAELTSTIKITGPGGYTWTKNISGLRGSSHNLTLGAAGTYTVTEDYELTIIGTPAGLIGALIKPVTETFLSSATPWTFYADTDGAIGTFKTMSLLASLSVSEHSDNIRVEISGMSVTITTTKLIDIGDLITATTSGVLIVATDVILSETPNGGTTPPAPTGGDMDVDIAISTQAFGIDQDGADREINEVVSNVGNSVNDVELFPADKEAQLADWVTAHTNNGRLDVLILWGVFPDSIYPGGNAQPDGSIAEQFLEAGNMIINTGRHMFYLSSGFCNAEGGPENMTDIPGIYNMYGGNMEVTTAGGQYLPSLSDFYGPQPLDLDDLQAPWEAEAIFAFDDEMNRADPVVIHDTSTGGRIAIFFQTVGPEYYRETHQGNDIPKGEVISEFILNWLPTVAGGSTAPPGGDDSTTTPAELVAYWNFDERQGTVVHDIAGNNNGIINGNPRWVEGYSGGGLELDGVTNYVDCGANPSLDITEAITIAAWIKVDDFQSWDGIVVKGVNSSSFGMQVWADGSLRFSSNWGILTGAIGSGGFNSDTKMAEGEWTHVAITHDGSRLRFYINGILDSSEVDQSVTFGTNTESLIMGCDFPGGDEYFDGVIDEVRIYNQALTGSEVRQIMGGTTPPSQPDPPPDDTPGDLSGLVLHLPFDEGSGITANDASGYGNHGQLMGNVQWVTGVNGTAVYISEDSADNMVLVRDDSTLNITDEITMAMWVSVKKMTYPWGSLLTKGETYMLHINPATPNVTIDPIVFIGNDKGIWPSGAGGQIPFDEWHHVVGIYDGQEKRTYIDGVLQGSHPRSGQIRVNDFDLAIGRDNRLCCNTRKDELLIDDVMIFNRAISDAEVRQIMAGTTPPSEPVEPPDGPTPGEFVLVGTDPDDSPVANIDQVFVSNDTDKITFQVTSHRRWADDVYFSMEIDADQNPNTGDPVDGVDHLVVVSIDGTDLSGGVFVYDPSQLDFVIIDATLFDIICSPNSDQFQVSVLLSDIGNPDAIDFEVWMAVADSVDVAPEMGLYTYVLGETSVPDPPTTARTLSITSAEASPGSSATVYLSISDATDIAGGDVQITYDSSVINIGEVIGTNLISGIDLVVNMNIPGIITIGMAGTDGISSGSGPLVNIELTVNASAQAGTTTTLRITDAEMYSESGATIPVSSQNGFVQIIQGVLKGDVDGDGKVRSKDARLALLIATGFMTPTSDQFWAADMNSDGRVRSNDAILILREAVGLAAPEKGVIASAGGPVSVTLAEAHGVAGESITVPLRVDDIAGLAAGDVSITYDSTVLRAVDVSSDSDMLLASNISDPGTVSISFASIDRLDSETLAQIRFEILADDVSPLKFQQAELYSPDALPLNTICVNKEFSSWAIPPERSALLQNFPNPFNPDTWIPYQLKEDREVTIRIYSAGGGLVRELDLGYKTAGLYVSRDRAVYWDGKNEQGEEVSSSVYFYSIRAGEFSGVKKMVIKK